GFGATTASSGPHRTPRCTILHHGDSRAALTLNRGVNVRILLAGGAGFVGSHLAARLLDAGHQLAIVDNLITGRAANLYALEKRYPGAHLEIEIEDACALTRFDGPVDAVLHLASPASPVDYLRHPVETMEAGATATRRLLEIAKAKNARFLLASTSEVYGDPK